jgi:hypothetical protein
MFRYVTASYLFTKLDNYVGPFIFLLCVPVHDGMRNRQGYHRMRCKIKICIFHIFHHRLDNHQVVVIFSSSFLLENANKYDTRTNKFAKPKDNENSQLHDTMVRNYPENDSERHQRFYIVNKKTITIIYH